MWDSWWIKWHWVKFLSKYFGFLLPIMVPIMFHAHQSTPADKMGLVAVRTPPK
jgi:hypothetical protein